MTEHPAHRVRERSPAFAPSCVRSRSPGESTKKAVRLREFFERSATEHPLVDRERCQCLYRGPVLTNDQHRFGIQPRQTPVDEPTVDLGAMDQRRAEPERALHRGDQPRGLRQIRSVRSTGTGGCRAENDFLRSPACQQRHDMLLQIDRQAFEAVVADCVADMARATIGSDQRERRRDLAHGHTDDGMPGFVDRDSADHRR